MADVPAPQRPGRPPRRDQRPRIRLRDVEWFQPAAERADGSDDAEVDAGGDAFGAGLYLISIALAPIALALLGFLPSGATGVLLVILLAVSGAEPWFMTEDLCDENGRSHYSFLALRTQIWLQLGGAAPAAVRALQTWRSKAAR